MFIIPTKEVTKSVTETVRNVLNKTDSIYLRGCVRLVERSYSFSFYSVCSAAKIEAKQAFAVPGWPLQVGTASQQDESSRYFRLSPQYLSVGAQCWQQDQQVLPKQLCFPWNKVPAASLEHAHGHTRDSLDELIEDTKQYGMVFSTQPSQDRFPYRQGAGIKAGTFPHLVLWLKQWPRTEENNTVPICFKICLQAKPDLLTERIIWCRRTQFPIT